MFLKFNRLTSRFLKFPQISLAFLIWPFLIHNRILRVLWNLTVMNHKLTGTFLHQVFFIKYTRFCNNNISRLVNKNIIIKFQTNFFEGLFKTKEPVGNCVITSSLPPNILKKFLLFLTLLRTKRKITVWINIICNLTTLSVPISILRWISIGTTCKILLIQKLPGELRMAFTTVILSYSSFVEGEGEKHRTNPSEKMRKRSRPHKLMETWLHFLFLSF